MSTEPKTEPLRPTPGTPAAEEDDSERSFLWEWLAAVAGITVVAFLLVCVVLATLSVIHGYERGQDKRAAENQTKIARQHLEQRAFEQYTGPQR
jgi:hypothetical protein